MYMNEIFPGNWRGDERPEHIKVSHSRADGTCRIDGFDLDWCPEVKAARYVTYRYIKEELERLSFRSGKRQFFVLSEAMESVGEALDWIEKDFIAKGKVPTRSSFAVKYRDTFVSGVVLMMEIDPFRCWDKLWLRWMTTTDWEKEVQMVMCWSGDEETEKVISGDADDIFDMSEVSETGSQDGKA